MIRFTIGISQKKKRPLVMLLVGNKPVRLGERDDHDSNFLLFEFTLDGPHLSEVLLARQSSQMPEKDQQSQISHVLL